MIYVIRKIKYCFLTLLYVLTLGSRTVYIHFWYSRQNTSILLLF